jgi:N-acetylglucosamine kinase-like BadF-type ATPase
MRYFLGVDGGGTKTHAVVADETGQAVGFAHGGPGNHESIGFDGMATVLQAVTTGALANAGITADQLAGAGFGLGGYDWPSDVEPTHRVIEGLGLNTPFAAANDAMIALIGGASEGWGVSLIAGTGCNARGRDRGGREGRVTGEGMLMGEAGGAGEVARRAVSRVAMEWTHRSPKTMLTGMFVNYFGAADVVDLLEGLCRHRYHVRAAMAPLVFEAAHAGDEIAAEVIRWSGRELGSLAHGIIHQLGFEALDFEVVMAGSLFKGGALFIDALSETIHAVAPGARLVHLGAPPVVGGVLLGMEQAGLRDPALRHRLIETVPALVAST